MARRWPWLLIVLAPLLPLWRAVFLGEGIGPFDQIRAMAPWNGPTPNTPWDVLQADGVIQFYPWRDLVLSSWGRFEVPGWNPYQLAGTPLLANSQSAALYPPHILLGILHIPTLFAMALLAWFHLALAGAGAAMLAKRYGASSTGQALAGLSFGLSPFMLAWTALPSVPSTVAWIPWALVAAHGAVRGEKRLALLLPVALAMMVLAGHLQFVAYGFMAVGLVTLVDAARLRSWRGFGAVIAGLAASVILAAVHLAPVLNYSQFSHRRNTPTEEGYMAYVDGAIKPYELVGLVVPDLVGNPTRYSVEEQGLSQYWPAFVKRGGNFAEGAISLGIVVTVLLCLLRRRQLKEGASLIALGALAFLLAVGSPLDRLLYFLVPGWSSTGSPGRIAALFVLAGCVLGASAFPEELEVLPPKALTARLGVFACLTVASILYVAFFAFELPSWIPGASAALVPTVVTRAASVGNAIGLALLLVTTLSVIGWQRRRQPLLMLVPMGVALVLSMHGLVRTAPADLKNDGPTTERIAVLGNPWDILGRANATLPPNTASISRIHDLAGYDSLLHRDTVALLKDIDGEDPAPPANGNMMLIKRNADLKKLAAAGVTEIWDRNGKTPLQGPGRADVEGHPAAITEESLTHLVLKATGPGKLTLRDRNLPGWTATVDGKPTDIRGTDWREMEIPNGEHTVVFRYTPPGLEMGAAVSLMGWIGWVGYALYSMRRTRNEAK
ncbi:hypothetical protein BH11ARM2_BH11ARM2_23050 [soil metagenome]